MKRTYTLRGRAKQQAETRHRILEATVDLYSSVGPALTTFSMVAERAGVQRHTLYAHFPDERSLKMACSGLVYERDPLPAATAWWNIAGPTERLATGLRAVYDWYERNAALMACVRRDVEFHALTRDISALRFDPSMAAWQEALGATLSVKQRAVLHLALNFFTWRSLVRDGGLGQKTAVEAMVQAINCTSETSSGA